MLPARKQQRARTYSRGIRLIVVVAIVVVTVVVVVVVVVVVELVVIVVVVVAVLVMAIIQAIRLFNVVPRALSIGAASFGIVVLANDRCQ